MKNKAKPTAPPSAPFAPRPGDRIIELESCILIIAEGADPAELFLSAHRILRGLAPLPTARRMRQ